MSNSWQDWHTQVLTKLRAIPEDLDHMDHIFLNDFYKRNEFAVVTLPPWPVFDWEWDSLRERIGDREVQFQMGRSNEPDFEMQSYKLVAQGRFGTFMDLLGDGPDNDVYIVAQNHEFNRASMQPVYDAITPMPTFLRPDASEGFLWIGGKTLTPLHCDRTNNIMCQLIGNKLVRLVAPSQFEKIDHRMGVHSNIFWLDEAQAERRGIKYVDVWLTPGSALFLPVGWWHCVRTFEPSVTAVYTSFIWDNYFVEGSP